MRSWSKGNKVAFSIAMLIIVVMVVTVILFSLQFAYFIEGKGSSLIKVNNDQEYADIVTRNRKIESASNWMYYRMSGTKSERIDENMSPPMAPSDESPEEDFTDTNAQQKDVGEGDSVKTDGRYIYSIFGDVVAITRASDLIVMARIKINNVNVLYLYKNNLVIISNIYDSAQEDIYVKGEINSIGKNKTLVSIYNVESPSEPVLSRQTTIDGEFKESRLTASRLFVVTAACSYEKLPIIASSAGDSAMTSYAVENGASNYQTVFYNIDVVTGEECSTSVLGAAGGYYVTSSKIYFFTNDYASRSKLNIYGVMNGRTSQSTRVFRFAAATLMYEDSEMVDGFIKDRYSIDEHNGYLRLVTTLQSGSILTILDSEMNVVAQVDKIAPNESVFAVRFRGNEGTLVTFLQVDPVFKLDLTDPLKPIVSKGLKEDGVSYYMHYLDDSKFTIGLGNDGTGTGLNSDIKVSMYDNSGAEPVNIKTYIISTAHSEALHNPRAFYYDSVRKQFGFTCTTLTREGCVDYYYRVNKSYIFDYDIENATFKLAGSVTLPSGITEEGTSGGIRILRINDNYYVVARWGMIMLDSNYNKLESLVYRS